MDHIMGQHDTTQPLDPDLPAQGGFPDTMFGSPQTTMDTLEYKKGSQKHS